jgi:1A family penicillin-binding protein
MDRRRKKLKKNKKIVVVVKPTEWYKKHFLLEVLYYIPLVYINVFKYTFKLALNGIRFGINWVKSYSALAAGFIISKTNHIKKSFKLPKLVIPKIEVPKVKMPEISAPKVKIPSLGIKSYFKSEYNGLKAEIKDLGALIAAAYLTSKKRLKKVANTKIEFPTVTLPKVEVPKIKVPQFEVRMPKIPKLKMPKITWPTISFSLAVPALFHTAKKTKTTKSMAMKHAQAKAMVKKHPTRGHEKKVIVAQPKKLLIALDFSPFRSVKTAVKSILFGILNVILWPFRTVYKVLRAIFTFEVKFRLFSFRTFLLVAFFVGLYLGTAAYFVVWEDLPKVENLATNEPRQTTTIYDRKGNVLYRLYNDEDRSIVPLNGIPQDLIHATIAIEDENFYQHSGLSIKGIVRAAKKTFLEDNMEGGSTITQQLVKNSLLTSERTYERKAKEAVMAVEVERKYTKDQILEMYLNRISYGGTAYGIKSAAKRYFGKDLETLTLAESSFLAGLPASPSKYSPFVGNLDAGKVRQRLVLDRMVASNYITQDAANSAYDEKLEFKSPSERIIAPHFVNYVISELEDKYGQMMVMQGGLDVFTSIDMDLQTQLEKIVDTEVSKLGKNRVSNGAAIITHPKTGEVLAMVGSKDYWDVENDGNVNIAISPRQPGSSIKPVTYAMALENGYTISTIIDDSPVSIKLGSNNVYKPVNYDGKFHGRVTLKQALANSYNIPAVKTLQKFGVPALVEQGKKMGITTWDDPSRFGLSLTLGAGEVKMTDMAVVYGVFANGGSKKTLNPILKIYDSYGNVIEQNDCVDFLDESPSILTRRAWFETNAMAATTTSTENPTVKVCPQEKVLSGYTAYMISNVLTDNKARSSAFGANSELNVTKKQFAVKTGTTNEEKDNWAIGYNDDYVVATWVGNNYNKPMVGLASGYVGSSTIWRKAVDYLIDNRPMAETISRPAGLIEVDICPLTNTLACSGCPNVTQLYEKGKEPQVACDPKVVRGILQREEEKRKEREEKQKDEENKDDSNDENSDD